MEETTDEIKIYVENNLRKTFPIFFELLGLNKIDWTSVNKVVKNRFIRQQALQEKRIEPLRIQASLYNIIPRAIDGDPQALRLLDYLQKLFENLCDRLDTNEKREIVPTLFGILTNVDLKYLNFIGELSVLNCYKQNYRCRLLKCEEPLLSTNTNGRKIDFKIHNLKQISYTALK